MKLCSHSRVAVAREAQAGLYRVKTSGDACSVRDVICLECGDSPDDFVVMDDPLAKPDPDCTYRRLKDDPYICVRLGAEGRER